MRLQNILLYFLGIFILTFLVSSAVTCLYSWIMYGSGRIDWESSVRLAIILGIVLTWTDARNKKMN